MFSGLGDMDKAHYTAKRRMTYVTYGNSLCANAAEWTLHPDSHDEIVLAICSRNDARAAKEAWTEVEMLSIDTEHWKQNLTELFRDNKSVMAIGHSDQHPFVCTV